MNIPLLLTVIIVSGIVAYVGDVLGKRLGKKRVSIFGLRPRQTAVLIAVTTGCAITVGTVAVLSLTSAEVRESLFYMQELKQQIAEAEAAKGTAEQAAAAAAQGLDSAQIELSRTRDDLGDAETARSEAVEHAETAGAAARSAEGDAARTRGELGNAEIRLRDLQTRQDTLTHDITGIEKDKRSAEEARDALILEAGKQAFAGSLPLFGYKDGLPIALARGRELARLVVAQGSEAPETRRALGGLLTDAEDAAKAAGCAPWDYAADQKEATAGLLLILMDAEVKTGPDWHFLDLKERLDAYDRYLASTADRIAQLSQRAPVYAMVRVGPYPVPKNRPAIVEFYVGLVRSAGLPVGSVLATVPAPVGAAKDEIAQACLDLAVKAREAARESTSLAGDYRGVIAPEKIADPSYETVENVVSEVVRLHSELNVGARLSAVVVPDPDKPGDYRNIDVPRYRIDVDPIL